MLEVLSMQVNVLSNPILVNLRICFRNFGYEVGESGIVTANYGSLLIFFMFFDITVTVIATCTIT